YHIPRSTDLRALHSFPTRRSSDLSSTDAFPSARFKAATGTQSAFSLRSSVTIASAYMPGTRSPLVFTTSTSVSMVDVVNTKGDLDRKSTRLNSSHSQISYAVFCLK